MSIRADILEAKSVFEAHVAEHKCMTGRGCSDRKRLWLAYMKVAERWGIEPDDVKRGADFYGQIQ
jgi:hypothetical protein